MVQRAGTKGGSLFAAGATVRVIRGWGGFGESARAQAFSRGLWYAPRLKIPKGLQRWKFLFHFEFQFDFEHFSNTYEFEKTLNMKSVSI
jgi:hypothetical protein